MVVVIEFPVESGVLNTLFGSVEKIEVEKDSGVSWSVMTPVGDGVSDESYAAHRR